MIRNSNFYLNLVGTSVTILGPFPRSTECFEENWSSRLPCYSRKGVKSPTGLDLWVSPCSFPGQGFVVLLHSRVHRVDCQCLLWAWVLRARQNTLVSRVSRVQTGVNPTRTSTVP